MKPHKYQNQVCLLDNNIHYRISDVFYMKGTLTKEGNVNDSIKHILDNPKQYSETLLYNYLVKKTKNSDIEAFGSCVKDTLLAKSVPHPADNELTVHMRLGDIMSNHNDVDIEKSKKFEPQIARWVGYNNRRKNINFRYYNKFYERYDIPKKIDTVNVVTALHFGGHEKSGLCTYDEDAIKNSFKVLNSFEKQTISSGLKFKITSNKDPDIDFCLLCLSKNFVLSRSGLSELADLVRESLFPKDQLFTIGINHNA